MPLLAKLNTKTAAICCFKVITIHTFITLLNRNNLLKVGGAALDVYSSEPPHKDEVVD